MVPIIVEAIYENGTLKLDRPLPLTEHQRVKVVIQNLGVPNELTYGLIGWMGDPQTVRKIALDPEFGIQGQP